MWGAAMKIYVWTWKKALSLLMGIALMSAVTAGSIALMVAAVPMEQQAVAAFAEDAPLFGTETANEDTAEVTATPAETLIDRSFRMEVIRTTPAPELEAKRVLIYHSHTWEAFQQVEGAAYEETEKWRTKDNQCNVVAVGEALANQLRASGCMVVHDTTAFEPPNLDQAYNRSLAMLEERTASGETYDLYIDLHRDAIASNSTLKRTVQIGGTDVARFMVLVGKGTGTGFDVKPDWEANLRIAQTLTDRLNAMADGLCRDVKIKSGRFNQHIAPRCILIECGNNLNTLEQVLNGIPYLAEALVQTMQNLSP